MDDVNQAAKALSRVKVAPVMAKAKAAAAPEGSPTAVADAPGEEDSGQEATTPPKFKLNAAARSWTPPPKESPPAAPSAAAARSDAKGGGPKRHCSACKKRLPKSDFSKSQWSKGKTASKCKGCIAKEHPVSEVMQEYNELCSRFSTKTTNPEVLRQHEELLHRKGEDGQSLYDRLWKEKLQFGELENVASSKEKAPAAPASEKKKVTVARGVNGQLVAREATEAYRVREDENISPKDRLIKYCEIRSVLDLGEENGGIVPEKVPVAAGEMKPYIGTPYEYWGLPEEGSLGKPKAFKKQLKKRCEYFRDADLKWMASHPDLVRPHFEEVGMMEGRTAMSDGDPLHFHFEASWRFYIDDVLRKIARDAPWQRPSPTNTEAYRVRDENTISPRDRLLEFCELSSINDQDGIEPESTVLSYPARTTSNTYWGISPAGGRSAADVAAWDFFMDFEMQYILNHVDLVEPHYEEVSGMGYRNSVSAVRNVIQMRRMNLPR